MAVNASEKGEAEAKPFECLGEPERPITEALCAGAGIAYEEAFQDAAAMAHLSQQIRQLDHDEFCKLPFCVTVEAEQFGAVVSLNPLYRLPAVSRFRYEKLAEIGAMPHMVFERGTIQEVLRAASLLHAQGERVILNIEGPFTILGLLVPSKEIYKGLYRQQDKLAELCAFITGELARYAGEAARQGVSVLSYADPTVAYDLVSPKIYQSFIGKITEQAVRAIQAAAPTVVLHLCSATSVGFERAGFCQSTPIMMARHTTYGEALAAVLNRPDCRLIGHGCVQRTRCPLETPCIYRLQLK